MGKVSHAHVLQLIQTLLKAAILAKGSDITVTADQAQRAERDFDLHIERIGSEFRLHLTGGNRPDGSKPDLHLPPDQKLWTPS